MDGFAQKVLVILTIGARYPSGKNNKFGPSLNVDLTRLFD